MVAASMVDTSQGKDDMLCFFGLVLACFAV